MTAPTEADTILPLAKNLRTLEWNIGSVGNALENKITT